MPFIGVWIGDDGETNERRIRSVDFLFLFKKK